MKYENLVMQLVKIQIQVKIPVENHIGIRHIDIDKICLRETGFWVCIDSSFGKSLLVTFKMNTFNTSFKHLPATDTPGRPHLNLKSPFEAEMLSILTDSLPRDIEYSLPLRSTTSGHTMSESLKGTVKLITEVIFRGTITLIVDNAGAMYAKEVCMHPSKEKRMTISLATTMRHAMAKKIRI